MRALLLMAALLGALGCSGVECQARLVLSTGDTAAQLIGTWGGFGTDSPVFITFNADGTSLTVESPNFYAPAGNSRRGTWRLTEGRLFIEAQDQGVPTIEGNNLVLTKAPDGPTSRHGAFTCTGGGFDP